MHPLSYNLSPSAQGRRSDHLPFGRLLLISLLLLLVLASGGSAAVAAPSLPQTELSWKNVRVDNKKATVFSLFEDSRGIMWIGTNGALYFYDGLSTRPIGPKQLMGAQIYALAEHNGKLYIGTNNGLFLYDYTSGQVSKSKVKAPNEIRAFLLTDSHLWIGSLGGLFDLNLADSSITDHTPELHHKSVYSLLRDSRGVIYAGTYSGVARWDSSARKFRPLRLRSAIAERPSLFANCMIESEDGESIYIGGEGALYKYTPAFESWEKIPGVGSDNVKSLALGDPGHVLVGTDNGLYDLSPTTSRHFRHDSRQELSLADNEIWCVFTDRRHNIWVGHERGFSIASNSKTLRTVKLSALVPSGEGNEIHHIMRDSRGDLWLGGTNGLIRLSEASGPKWYRHGSAPGTLSHNRIRGILEDSSHGLWFATDGGINRYNPLTDGFEDYYVTDSAGRHQTNWVYSLVEDHSGFWVGSFLGGLHHVARESLRLPGTTVAAETSVNAETHRNGRALLPNNLVSNVIRDRDGHLWVLLFRDPRLTHYDPRAGKARSFDIHAITGEYPVYIASDARGRLWCGVKGGVVVFDEDSHTFVKFPVSDADSDESILAMGPVGTGMWVSTQSNLWKIDGRSLKASLLPIPAQSYTAIYEDPLGGKVYLGGVDEILEADRQAATLSPDYRSLKMVLNAAPDGSLNLSDLKGGVKGIDIPYGGSLTMVVSTLDYSPDVAERYMYKLAVSPTDTTAEGWVMMPEGSNTITLSDLKGGDYHLLVKSASTPAPPVAVPLTVRGPAALSWWAIMIYAAAALGLAALTAWYVRHRNLRAFQEQQRQAALENVERKLSFLSSISHDFKTPLSMILGPVSLMKEKAKDPGQKKSLEAVYDNAVRLNEMIHRTLELQQLEDTDGSLLLTSVFDVVEFCRGVFEVFRENHPQKTFVFHTSAPRVLIEADAVKFESVITNLLSNACKYSKEGATVSLGIRPEGSQVEIAVSDDGFGISDSDQPLVFQRTFRAPATSQLREGTGLGLYLIKKYLEMMGGTIDLYSKEGEGTSFVVTLPVAEAGSPAKPSASPADGADRPSILIVEDNLQIAGFLTEILSHDYTCLTAENGSSGLAVAASSMPDLIIADEMMPIMSGLEMVKRMKQNPRLSSVPVIMLTARSDNKTETESIKLGIDAFMGKPFEPNALLGRIRQLLKARRELKEKVRIQTIAEAEFKPIEAESVNEKTLARVTAIIEENISDPDLNVNMLSEKSGLPTKQLYRLVKKYIGITPLDYIRRARLGKAAALLEQHRFTVAEISYMVGFKTPSYFAKCFQAQFGVKPSQYEPGQETPGEKIGQSSES